MQSSLGVIEKKVLGALLILSDKQNVANATQVQIAKAMGYKKGGGAITFALKSLEMNNHITILENNNIKVLL